MNEHQRITDLECEVAILREIVRRMMDKVPGVRAVTREALTKCSTTEENVSLAQFDPPALRDRAQAYIGRLPLELG